MRACTLLGLVAAAASSVTAVAVCVRADAGADGPPPVVTKAYGCDRRTSQCDLIVAYIPRPKVHGLISSSDLGMSLSPDGKWVACLWRGNLWYRRLGLMRWASLPVRREWGRPVWLRWLSDPRGVLVLEGLQNKEVGLLNASTGEYVVLVSEREPGRESRAGTVCAIPHRVAVRNPCGLVEVRAARVDGRDDRGATYLFDQNGRLRTTIEAESALVAWSPDCHAAIGIEDEKGLMPRTVMMLDPRTFQMHREVFADRPIDAGWSPDSRFLALITSKKGERAGCACTGIYPGTLAVLDAGTGRVRRYPRYSPARRPTWSPDGRYLALGCTSIMEVATAKVRRLPLRLRRAAATPHIVAWSPDGRYVLYRPEDDRGRQAVWLLDTRTWRVTSAGRGDRYLPQAAKPGEYVYPRVRVKHSDGRAGYEWGWHWERLAQVTYYYEWNELTRHRRLFIGRVGRAARMLIVDRPLAVTRWSRDASDAERDMGRGWPGVG